MAKHFNIKIQGRVHGIGLRHFLSKKAEELGICGFVSNQADGSVYVEAEGQEDILQEFCNFCKKGNAWSKVTDVDIKKDALKDFTDFSIIVE